jgi:outer membrane protein
MSVVMTKKQIELIVLICGLVLSGFAHAAIGLVALFEQAQTQDAKLAQAKAQLQADQEIINQAKAILMPTLSGQIGYQQNDYSKPVIMAAKESLVEKIVLNQSLFDVSAWARYEQAKSLMQQSVLQYQLSEQDLVLRLSQAYFDVLRAQQLLALAISQKESIGKQRDKISEGVRVGLTNPVDLLEVQARYDLAESDEINGQNQLAIANEALARLIRAASVPNLKTLTLDTSLPILSESPNVLADKYAEQNLTVKLGKQKLVVSEYEVDAQRAGHYPTLALQGSLANQDGILSSSATASPYPYQTNSIGLVLNVPLYAGGMVNSQVRKAEYLRSANQEGFRNSKEQARVDILTLAKTVILGKTRLAALRNAVKSNDAFVAAAEEGNRVGMKDLVDVLNARTQFLKAKQDLANALYDDVMSRLKLKSAEGQLSSDDLVGIEAYLRDAN